MIKEDKKDMLVFIGRFQPLTRAHMSIISTARNKAKKVLVLVGSSGEPRTIKNPFTFDERKGMINEAFHDVIVKPIFDYPYNDTKWLAGVQRTISETVNEEFGSVINPKVGLIGHKKDSSSYYLNMFVNLRKHSIDVATNFDGINATDVRNAFYENDACYYESGNKKHFYKHLSNEVYTFCDIFFKSEEGKALIESYADNKKYVESWAQSPYPPTFVTVDNVVVQSGHVLLIERKFNPGKGLWALPGGFVENDKTIEQCLIKELREETGLKVVDKVLLGNIVNRHVFDKPDRSIRGRTITHAFHIDLGFFPELPVVKGGDDAAKAKWVPLGEVKRDRMFEDHAHIISHFTGIN